LVVSRNTEVGLWVSVVLLVSIFIVYLRKTSREILLLALWLLIGSLGLALLRQEVYDHYFGFLYPAPFLIIAAALGEFKNEKSKKAVAAIALLIFILAFVGEHPFKYSPDRQLQRSMLIAEKIAQEAKGERFNLATISQTTNRDTYQ